ncbi:MAG TPA: ATP synthase F1 subunit gamma [Candidatus Paceibacterota bacterium]|jgi:F-type H+-transporting ATPase subunit gamma|nr:ATP synthase F1 subunit gamma [Candidatus Paceibacterota bacterium]
MESAQNIKRRMRSVQNIGTITKAMELVAATKMRRSQELALNSRPYAYTALELLGILSDMKDIKMPEILQARTVTKTVFMVVTSDKGLAGAFNSSVLHKFEHYLQENNINSRDPQYAFIAVGQKAKSHLERRGLNVINGFVHVGDFTQMEEAEPISTFLIEGFLRGDFDRVVSFATNFVTALRQEVLVRELLPVSYEKIKESIELLKPEAGKYSQYIDTESLAGGREKEYIIEPSPEAVLERLAVQLLKIRVYHLILEANASEHSARRVAMKNASDNAAELSTDLNIEYNKSRQAAITNQLIEIASAAQALE